MTRQAEKKIKVLLADDHMVVRMGIASLLTFAGGLEVVGEADNGVDAVKMAHELKPDVVLMDLQMPELGGAEATARIHADNPAVKILILTTFGTSAELKKAMDAGATGALVKSSSRTEIVDAIRGIMAGKQVLSDEIRHTIENFSSMPELSPRQIEILNLVAKGFANHDVARILGISVNSVKDHLKNIYAVLGASSRTEATSIALNLELITA